MNFRFKCLLQWLFSSIPQGEKLNFLFQKHYSKTMFSEEWFNSKIKAAQSHYENFQKYNSLENLSNTYYEFGAGWDLIIPIQMGVNGFQVYTIDIRKLVFPELINNSLNNFRKLGTKLPVTEFSNEADVLTYLENNCKVVYQAPRDARATGLLSNTIDFISSTATFEHIPKNDITLILKECYRILKKGGIVSLKIDYRDHWSFFDNTISPYNYLKYSTNKWKKYNPSLHYQNRLRHIQYIEIIESAGFKIKYENLEEPTEDQLNNLKQMKLDSEFEKYSINDLKILQSTIVLMK